MKQNQKKSGKRAPMQPLSKKQRKKLEKRGVQIKTRAPREKMPREKKWFISLVAAICVMAIVCGTFGGILLSRAIEKWTDNPYASVYEEINLRKHIKVRNINEEFYTGNIFDFSEVEKSYAPMTLADMDEYIEGVRVNYRTLNKEMQKDRVIGLADTVSLYVTDIFKGDAPVTADAEKENRLTIPSKMEALFGTYTSPISLTVGGELFGDDFDNKLIAKGVKPIDSVREIRKNNALLDDGTYHTFTTDDVVCITYYFQKSKGESSTPGSSNLEERYVWDDSSYEADYAKLQARVDMKELEEGFAAALVENCKAIGETFTFVLEDYDLADDGKKSNYKVTAQVLFVVEEEVPVDITFTVPEGYFGESDGDFYELNGKTATLRVHIQYVDDYEPATFNRQFIIDTLKMEISATDEKGAIQEYKEKQLEILNQQIADAKLLAQYDAAIAALVTKATNAGYFLETVSDEQEIAAAVQAQITRGLLEQYLAANGAPPSTSDLDTYVINIAKMQDVSISGTDEYISMIYSNEGEAIKLTELLVYTIFKNERMKITDEAFDAAYAEYMENLTGSMWDKETHNEEYFLALYGEETIKSWVRRDLVYKMVGEYLMANNRYNTNATKAIG